MSIVLLCVGGIILFGLWAAKRIFAALHYYPRVR
jgi:hypothetical protein